jgi:hypothetical protein
VNVAKHPIIVEGPDGGGKTTLARALAQDFNRKYTRPEQALLSSVDGPTPGLVEWWDHELAQGDQYLAHRVYDRCFYISDPIYQMAVEDRELLIPPPTLAHGIMRLWNAEPVIIFCLPDFGITLTNVRAENRERLRGVSAQALSKIWNMYWATYAMWSNALYDQVILYDYTEPNAHDRLAGVLDAAMVGA